MALPPTFEKLRLGLTAEQRGVIQAIVPFLLHLFPGFTGALAGVFYLLVHLGGFLGPVVSGLLAKGFQVDPGWIVHVDSFAIILLPIPISARAAAGAGWSASRLRNGSTTKGAEARAGRGARSPVSSRRTPRTSNAALRNAAAAVCKDISETGH